MTELSCLVGEELNAVCFVMDYVEFHFNGRILRALANPTLERGEISVYFPGGGSRDAFCALIGCRIEAVNVFPEKLIRVVFEGNVILSIPLDGDAGPESAHFVPGLNQPISVY